MSAVGARKSFRLIKLFIVLLFIHSDQTLVDLKFYSMLEKL